MFPCDGLFSAYYTASLGCGLGSVGTCSGRNFINRTKKLIELDKVKSPASDMCFTTFPVRKIHLKVPQPYPIRKVSNHLYYIPQK